ncbi:Crp/Fnr family transcriptional regulator [Gorillibacterium sp. sgz5001074]|uniref:Crp/Fnr family transcriptional regulator n=1 Tax=Gorillibacterium sp. sgz5001074 TaxID=3446695 RepID=UPI003F67F8E3
MKNDIISILRSVPVFEQLSEEELATMSPLFLERRYKKGAILFFEDDKGDEFYIIKSGLVKVYRMDEQKEITLSLFRGGDFFGDMALLSPESRRSATAETLEPTVLYSLSRYEFRRYLEQSPTLAIKMLEIIAVRLRKTNELIQDLTLLDVRRRVYKMLLRLAGEYGVKEPIGTVIHVKLTHQQLAGMVGTVRESVTKILLELQDENLLTFQNRHIVLINPDKLSDKL